MSRASGLFPVFFYRFETLLDGPLVTVLREDYRATDQNRTKRRKFKLASVCVVLTIKLQNIVVENCHCSFTDLFSPNETNWRYTIFKKVHLRRSSPSQLRSLIWFEQKNAMISIVAASIRELYHMESNAFWPNYSPSAWFTNSLTCNFSINDTFHPKLLRLTLFLLKYVCLAIFLIIEKTV